MCTSSYHVITSSFAVMSSVTHGLSINLIKDEVYTCFCYRLYGLPYFAVPFVVAALSRIERSSTVSGSRYHQILSKYCNILPKYKRGSVTRCCNCGCEG